MQTSNLGRWIDELQAAIENVKKRLSKTAGIVDGLPSFDVTEPTDGQVFKYDDGDWVNGDMPSFDVTEPVDGQILMYDNGDWVNSNIEIPAGEEWEVLAYNAVGFPLGTDPVYTCPEGTNLSDFTELAFLQYYANTNVAQGKGLLHVFPTDIYAKLAAVEPTEGSFPFAAYADPIVYAFYTNQRYGYKLSFTNGTIVQTDNASDTGTTSFRLVAVFGKRKASN